MNNLLTWPPSFALRYSSRAKSIRLQINPKRGLQLIVPKNFDPNHAYSVIQQHRVWIERTLLRITPLNSPVAAVTLPKEIKLLALNELWMIDYQTSPQSRIQLTETSNGQLLLQGKIDNHSKVKERLLEWLRAKGKQALIPWLQHLSKEKQLQFSGVTIRNTSTRWGSCSVSKRISLNCKLLLLPAELVEHILLHELCHTIHLNHSKRFWNLLAKVNPQCPNLRKQVKKAQDYMPSWLEN